MSAWRTLAGGIMAFVVLVLLTLHTLPIKGVTIDQISIGLLVMATVALLLPDLTRLVAPGGWEVDFQRNVTAAETGLTRAPGTPTLGSSTGTMTTGAPTDAGLRLAQQRLTIEQVIRQMAGDAGSGALSAVIQDLTRNHLIDPELARATDAFLSAVDSFLAGRQGRVPAGLVRALTVGEELLRRLTPPAGSV